MILSGARRKAGAFFVLTGALTLSVALAGYGEGIGWQWLQSRRPPTSSLVGRVATPLRPGDPVARLRIPGIDLDLAVIEGTRAEDLRKAPGHLTGTGLPGGDENCVIAGHRDLHFRRLGQVNPGERIDLEAGGRRYRYRVESRRVVPPSETSLLARGSHPLLTLVTCYPFRHIGPAPQRFVLTARLESAGAVER